jgi:transcriptional regulator with XRE-family HTH domain
MYRLCGGRPLLLVARAAGMQKRDLGRLLRGRNTRASFDLARRVARALRVTLEDLGAYLDRVRSDPF